MLHSVCSSCFSTFRESLLVLFSWVKQSWISWHPKRATASNTSRLKTETPNFYPAFHIYCPILLKWGIACCTQCGQTVVCFVKIEPRKIVLNLWTTWKYIYESNANSHAFLDSKECLGCLCTTSRPAPYVIFLILAENIFLISDRHNNNNNNCALIVVCLLMWHTNPPS